MRFTCEPLGLLPVEYISIMEALETVTAGKEGATVEAVERSAKIRCSAETVLRALQKEALVKNVKGKSIEYALTHTGYDNLALNALRKEGAVSGLGEKIGVGKESDVYLGVTEKEKLVCVKIHRLGRICFRNVKSKREYYERKKGSRPPDWMHLSKVSAEREYMFMEELKKGGIPVPSPVARNRHIVVMEYLKGYTLLAKMRKKSVPLAEVKKAAEKTLEEIRRQGYAHGDYNEFNIMVRNDLRKLKVIDFPQMVRITDPRGPEYYQRDLHSLHKYFGIDTPSISNGSDNGSPNGINNGSSNENGTESTNPY